MFQPKKIYLVTNMREEFQNESTVSKNPYNDHPSKKSIEFIINELRYFNYNVEYFGGVNELINAYDNKLTFNDALFLNISDGLTQTSRKAQTALLLELLNVHFAGSDALSRLIAGNKHYAKQCLSDISISIPFGQVVHSTTEIDNLAIRFPIVVKPNREGSSIGITQKSFCSKEEDLHVILPKMLDQFKEIIIEQYIEGYELTNFIIGNPGNFRLNEIVMSTYDNQEYFKEFLFGIDEKSSGKRKQFLAEPIIGENIADKIRRKSEEIFQILCMRDFARIDYRLKQNGDFYFIEINGNPVISESSELGVISKAKGIKFGFIMSELVQGAITRINHG